MYKVYILYSKLLKKYYIGHTNNLKERLYRHNRGLVRSTKSGKPWILVYSQSFETKSEAYKRELQIKSYKGGEAFKKLISKRVDGGVVNRTRLPPPSPRRRRDRGGINKSDYSIKGN